MSSSNSENKNTNKQMQLEQQQRKTRMKYARILGIIVIIILLFGVAIAWRPDTQPKDQEPTVSLPPNLDGSADAPVKIVEYSDFGCPTCRVWHNAGIQETLKEEFGDQISFEFRHYPVITKQSPKAAEAGQCAAEQNMFWEYHDYIFENTPHGALSISDLNEYAKAIGLNQSQFATCLDSGKYEPMVRAQWDAALADGAHSTPTFYVNGRQTSPMIELLSVQIQTELAN